MITTSGSSADLQTAGATTATARWTQPTISGCGRSRNTPWPGPAPEPATWTTIVGHLVGASGAGAASGRDRHADHNHNSDRHAPGGNEHVLADEYANRDGNQHADTNKHAWTCDRDIHSDQNGHSDGHSDDDSDCRGGYSNIRHYPAGHGHGHADAVCDCDRHADPNGDADRDGHLHVRRWGLQPAAERDDGVCGGAERRGAEPGQLDVRGVVPR
jgi:hypothetical protein